MSVEESAAAVRSWWQAANLLKGKQDTSSYVYKLDARVKGMCMERTNSGLDEPGLRRLATGGMRCAEAWHQREHVQKQIQN